MIVRSFSQHYVLSRVIGFKLKGFGYFFFKTQHKRTHIQIKLAGFEVNDSEQASLEILPAEVLQFLRNEKNGFQNFCLYDLKRKLFKHEQQINATLLKTMSDFHLSFFLRQNLSTMKLKQKFHLQKVSNPLMIQIINCVWKSHIHFPFLILFQGTSQISYLKIFLNRQNKVSQTSFSCLVDALMRGWTT